MGQPLHTHDPPDHDHQGGGRGRVAGLYHVYNWNTPRNLSVFSPRCQSIGWKVMAPCVLMMNTGGDPDLFWNGFTLMVCHLSLAPSRLRSELWCMREIEAKPLILWRRLLVCNTQHCYKPMSHRQKKSGIHAPAEARGNTCTM